MRFSHRGERGQREGKHRSLGEKRDKDVDMDLPGSEAENPRAPHRHTERRGISEREQGHGAKKQGK